MPLVRQKKGVSALGTAMSAIGGIIIFLGLIASIMFSVNLNEFLNGIDELFPGTSDSLRSAGLIYTIGIAVSAVLTGFLFIAIGELLNRVRSIQETVAPDTMEDTEEKEEKESKKWEPEKQLDDYSPNN